MIISTAVGAAVRGAHGHEKAGTMSTDTPETTFASLLRRYRLAAGVRAL